MIALLALAAVAAVAPSFNPPLGRDVLYETEQSRPTAAGAQRYRMVNRLAFARDPGGWRLTLTLVDISTDAPPDAAALFDAGMRPFLDTAIVMRLDPDGRPTAALNTAEAWAAITASLARVERDLAARNGGDSGATRAMSAFFKGFAALEGPAREAKLLETANMLVGFDLPALRPGESGPWSTEGGGARATGTIALDQADAAALAYHVVSSTTLPGQPAALAEDSRFRIDRTSGLLLDSRTTRRMGATLLSEESVRRLR